MVAVHTGETHMKIAEDHAVVFYTGAEEPPIIDFAGIDGPERKRIGQKIAEACETWGFFQLINHGVDESLMKRVKDVFAQFFHLPEEEKLKLRSDPAMRESPKYFGYRSPSLGDNRLLKSTEYFFNIYGTGNQDYIDRQPTNPPAFRNWACPQKRLNERWLQSTNYYQPSHGNDKTWDVPPHTDPSGCTLLRSDEVVGTHVKKDDRWAQVNPVPSALLFNVADQIEVLTNGRFKSVEHKGLPHKTQDRLNAHSYLHESFYNYYDRSVT